SPRFQVKITDGYSNKSFEHYCLADTGSEVSLISKDLIVKHKFSVRPANGVNLVAANLSPLECEGKARVILSCKNRKTVETEAIICQNMGTEVIVGRQVLTLMGIIPEGFPNVVAG
ncbi:Hypothetical predicted protein, partial [Paramuricea clavata]